VIVNRFDEVSSQRTSCNTHCNVTPTGIHPDVYYTLDDVACALQLESDELHDLREYVCDVGRGIDPIRLHNTFVSTGREWYQALRQSEAAAADAHD
jgi:hypothetical protein